MIALDKSQRSRGGFWLNRLRCWPGNWSWPERDRQSQHASRSIRSSHPEQRRPHHHGAHPDDIAPPRRPQTGRDAGRRHALGAPSHSHRQHAGESHRARPSLARYARVRRLRHRPGLAKAEAINESYLGRVLRLTLLSPTLIEAILEGRQPATLELDDPLKQFPVE
jgi:hypothetical protein